IPPPRAATLPLRPLSARARASPQNMVSASIAPSCRINAARLLHPQTLGNPPDSTQQKYALEHHYALVPAKGSQDNLDGKPWARVWHADTIIGLDWTAPERRPNRTKFVVAALGLGLGASSDNAPAQTVSQPYRVGGLLY